jgi:hypothetical protein
MPVTGRKPKPEGQAITRHKPTTDWVEVEDVPYDGERPDLPAKRTVMTQFGPKDFAVKKMTRQWWDVISSMPHCNLWTLSDWAFAVTTAMVADAVFSGTTGAAAELRQREKILGTTVDFRRDLRIRYVDPKTSVETAANVTQLDDYRDL